MPTTIAKRGHHPQHSPFLPQMAASRTALRVGAAHVALLAFGTPGGTRAQCSAGEQSEIGSSLLQRRDRACRTILAQLADKNRHRRGGGGGAASGVPASQQLRAMERALVAAGNEECKDDLQRSALTRAAMNGDPDVVKLLLTYGYDLNGRDVNRLTPLHYAAWKGHAEVVARLLAEGADPALYDDFGTTPLHKAAAFGHLVIVQQLLRTGRIPVDTKTGPVQAPPHYEAVSLHQTALQVALRPMASITPTDRRAVVDALLDFGASPNVTDIHGKTALHYAVDLGDVTLVWMVLRKGAEGGVVDETGKRAVDGVTWKTCFLYPLLLVGRVL